MAYDVTTIYAAAVAKMKPEDIDHHCSDLYLRKNAVSDELVAQYESRPNIKKFKDNIDKVWWYEIPFAYPDHFKPGGEDKSDV